MTHKPERITAPSYRPFCFDITVIQERKDESKYVRRVHFVVMRHDGRHSHAPSAGVPNRPANPVTRKFILRRRPMVVISGVKAATHTATEETYVPEKNPNRRANIMNPATELNDKKTNIKI
jgi:hypothetical protein